MSVRGMGASGKSDFLVGAFERNVEPSKERVDIWTVKSKNKCWGEFRRAAKVYNHPECKSGRKVRKMKDPPSLQSEGQYAAGSWELDGMNVVRLFRSYLY